MVQFWMTSYVINIAFLIKSVEVPDLPHMFGQWRSFEINFVNVIWCFTVGSREGRTPLSRTISESCMGSDINLSQYSQIPCLRMPIKVASENHKIWVFNFYFKVKICQLIKKINKCRKWGFTFRISIQYSIEIVMTKYQFRDNAFIK